MALAWTTGNLGSNEGIQPVLVRDVIYIGPAFHSYLVRR